MLSGKGNCPVALIHTTKGKAEPIGRGGHGREDMRRAREKFFEAAAKSAAPSVSDRPSDARQFIIQRFDFIQMPFSQALD